MHVPLCLIVQEKLVLACLGSRLGRFSSFDDGLRTDFTCWGGIYRRRGHSSTTWRRLRPSEIRTCSSVSCTTGAMERFAQYKPCVIDDRLSCLSSLGSDHSAPFDYDTRNSPAAAPRWCARSCVVPLRTFNSCLVTSLRHRQGIGTPTPDGSSYGSIGEDQRQLVLLLRPSLAGIPVSQSCHDHPSTCL